jgi:hypothetical protein
MNFLISILQASGFPCKKPFLVLETHPTLAMEILQNPGDFGAKDVLDALGGGVIKLLLQLNEISVHNLYLKEKGMTPLNLIYSEPF